MRDEINESEISREKNLTKERSHEVTKQILVIIMKEFVRVLSHP